MIIYSLVSYVVTRSRYKGRRLLDLAAWVPWAVPSLILGLGILWAVLLSPLAVLYGTLTVLILAHIVRGFPFGTQIMGCEHDPDQPRAGGGRPHPQASWPSTFRRIWLPLVKNGFVAGWVIQFTVSFSDLATVAFLYGAKSTVLPTLFLSQWSNGRLEEAAVAALMMTVIVLAVVVVVRRLVQGSVRTTTRGLAEIADPGGFERRNAMLSREDNELLCRVGPGTPMGDLMRQYWIPALMSSELPAPDCPPVRVRLLGENLDRLPRRRPARSASSRTPARTAAPRCSSAATRKRACAASTTAGSSTSTAPASTCRPSRPRATSSARCAPRPTRASSATASSGPTWARARRRRRCPTSSPTCWPQGEYAVQKVLRECNWFQGARGRHRHEPPRLPAPRRRQAREHARPARSTTTPSPTAPRGTRWSTPSSARPTAPTARPRPTRYYWRIAHFLFPFYTMIPTGVLGMQVLVRAWVPDRRRPHDVLEHRRRRASRDGYRAPPAARPGSTPAARPVAAAGAERAASSSCPTPRTGSASSASPRTRTTTT